MLRRRFMMSQASKSSGDYSFVNELIADGRQWIDTGVVPSENIGIDCNVYFNLKPMFNIFGSRDSANNNNISGFVNGKDFIADFSIINFNNGRCSVSSDQSKSKPINIVINNKIRKITSVETGNVLGEQSKIITGTMSATKIMLLYDMRGSFTTEKMVGSFYYFKITDGEQLIRDFVPAVNNATGEAGMFDKVNNVFYRNQGEGEFTWK